MLNAASLSVPNQVAPGEIVTVFGVGIGPRGGIVSELNDQGEVPDALDGLRVLFNGAAVPVLYGDEGQVNAIAPFSLQSGTTASLEMEYQGQRTPAVPVAVVDSQAELFSLDGSGSGSALVHLEQSC
jgi:uncharacterized protein (TIGR03437 family)